MSERRPDIAIVGLGLIGGSLGLAWRRAAAVSHIVGVDPSVDARRRAIETGVVDHAVADLSQLPVNLDVVVLAAPLQSVLAMAEQVAAVVRPEMIVTDVCSAKREVVAVYEAQLTGRAAFVGGHPMAGSERHGITAANPLLFRNAPYVLTPTERTPASAVAVVKRLVEALGAKVFTLSPADHDRAIAIISHLPQLLASTLMLTTGQAIEESAPRGINPMHLAGGGFRDTTRIAASPAAMWRDILLANRDQVLEHVERFEANLALMKQAIRDQQGDTLVALLDQAARLRQRAD